MNGPKAITPLMLLTAIAVVCLIVAIALFAMFSSGLFNHYDASAVESWSGPSPALALIPLGIGVLCGVGALVLWGTQTSKR